MDELLIEEKKYVSSKRAAKMTGYAKDYIGQLCREGRVPARLIGRSWYVLETAIQDHRFGDTSDTPMKSEKKAVRSESPVAAFPSTWEAPRYEASSIEVLPSVNRLQDVRTPIAPDTTREDTEFSQRLQDSWRAWFDRIEPVISEEIASPEPASVLEPEIPQEIEETSEVNIPIRSVYQPLPADLMPDLVAEAPSREESIYEEEKRDSGRAIPVLVQLTGALLAFVLAILAVAGTGYFDTYILSNRQASLIAGVSLYNK